MRVILKELSTFIFCLPRLSCRGLGRLSDGGPIVGRTVRGAWTTTCIVSSECRYGKNATNGEACDSDIFALTLESGFLVLLVEGDPSVESAVPSRAIDIMDDAREWPPFLTELAGFLEDAGGSATSLRGRFGDGPGRLE